MTFSVKDIQKHYGVGEHTVLSWIRSGELKPINVAKKPGGRPHWRVTPEALAEFELLRESRPSPKPSRRSKKQSAPGPYPTR